MSIVKIKVGEKMMLAAKVGESTYIDIEGHLRTCKPEEVFRTRNIPENVKVAFKQVVNIQKQQDKETQKFEIIRQNYNTRISQLKQQREDATKQLRNAIGILSFNEFKTAFWEALPEAVKTEIVRKGYTVNEPYGICFNRNQYMYLSKYAMIQKYYRAGSFVYEEYDGTIQMYDNATEDATYQRYLKQYSSVINGINAPFVETLYLGDKDSLNYSACYKLKLPEILTKDGAVELAKKICK